MPSLLPLLELRSSYPSKEFLGMTQILLPIPFSGHRSLHTRVLARFYLRGNKEIAPQPLLHFLWEIQRQTVFHGSSSFTEVLRSYRSHCIKNVAFQTPHSCMWALRHSNWRVRSPPFSFLFSEKAPSLGSTDHSNTP